MKRRDFITTAAIAAGATLTPFQLAFAAQKTSRFQLSMIGAASTAKVSSDSMRVHFDAWVPAQTGAVLSAMDVSAMFYLADSSLASCCAWSYRVRGPYGNSNRSSVVAGSRTLQALAVDYQLASGRAYGREQCDLGSPLKPGRYVLAGPRSDGTRADLSGYTIGSNYDAPLISAANHQRDFDYLAFRIEVPITVLTG